MIRLKRTFVDPDGSFAIPLVGIVWGTGAAITSPIWAPYALAAAGGAAVGYVGYKAYELWQEKNPPSWEDLGYDPTKCPGEGYVWKGKGTPQSGKGSWVRGEGKEEEILHPDLNHPDPHGPHWDYKGPGRPWRRIKPDGTCEYK